MPIHPADLSAAAPITPENVGSRHPRRHTKAHYRQHSPRAARANSAREVRPASHADVTRTTSVERPAGKRTDVAVDAAIRLGDATLVSDLVLLTSVPGTLVPVSGTPLTRCRLPRAERGTSATGGRRSRRCGGGPGHRGTRHPSSPPPLVTPRRTHYPGWLVRGSTCSVRICEGLSLRRPTTPARTHAVVMTPNAMTSRLKRLFLRRIRRRGRRYGNRGHDRGIGGSG